MSTVSSNLADAKRSAEAMIRELEDPEAEQSDGEDSKAVEIKARSKSPERHSPSIGSLRKFKTKFRWKKVIPDTINPYKSRTYR